MKVFTVLAGIILLPIVLIVLGVLFCEANKYYWDRKIDGWCEENGTYEIFERISITKEEAEAMRKKNQRLVVLVPGFEVNGESYSVETKTEVIRKKLPELKKRTTFIVRNKDKKIMTKLFSYSRVGGDFPTIIGHFSSYSCPNFENIKERGDLIYRVVGGES